MFIFAWVHPLSVMESSGQGLWLRAQSSEHREKSLTFSLQLWKFLASNCAHFPLDLSNLHRKNDVKVKFYKPKRDKNGQNRTEPDKTGQTPVNCRVQGREQGAQNSGLRAGGTQGAKRRSSAKPLDLPFIYLFIYLFIFYYLMMKFFLFGSFSFLEMC